MRDLCVQRQGALDRGVGLVPESGGSKRDRRPTSCSSAAATSGTLGYLSQADEVNAPAAEVPDQYVRWPETAQTAELRVRVLAEAGQNDEALAAADISIGAYLAGGDGTLAQQAEVTRIAAIVEGLRMASARRLSRG